MNLGWYAVQSESVVQWLSCTVSVYLLSLEAHTSEHCIIIYCKLIQLNFCHFLLRLQKRDAFLDSGQLVKGSQVWYPAFPTNIYCKSFSWKFNNSLRRAGATLDFFFTFSKSKHIKGLNKSLKRKLKKKILDLFF
jgi:hypothetical protein